MEKIFALVSKDAEYNRRLVTKINTSKQIGFLAAGFDSFDSMLNSLGKKIPSIVAFTKDQMENISYFFDKEMENSVNYRDDMEIVYLSDTNFQDDSRQCLPMDLIEKNVNVVFRFQKLSSVLAEIFPRQNRVSDGTRIITVFSPDLVADEEWVTEKLVRQQKTLYVPMLPFPDGMDVGNPGLSDLIYELRNEKDCKISFFEKISKNQEYEQVRGFTCFLDLLQIEEEDVKRLIDFLVGLNNYDRIVFYVNTINSGILCLFKSCDEIILPEKGYGFTQRDLLNNKDSLSQRDILGQRGRFETGSRRKESDTEKFLSQIKFAGWHDILSKTVVMEV